LIEDRFLALPAEVFCLSTSTQTTSETVGRGSAIEASGNLTMQAGIDIAF
jgi:hypothetical protein